MTRAAWLGGAIALLHAGIACAEAQKPAAAATAVPGAGQVALALMLVLAVVAGIVWLLRRMSVLPMPAGRLVTVVGAAAVGQRERVVLVEVGGTWIVVGVAPGRVSALHAMPRSAALEAAPPRDDAARGFPAWLRKTLEKRSHG